MAWSAKSCPVPRRDERVWNKSEATRAAVRDGWMSTGDAAYMDKDGYVFIHDRVKDMIRTGGESVYPAEVENALFGHPAIPRRRDRHP